MRIHKVVILAAGLIAAMAAAESPQAWDHAVRRALDDLQAGRAASAEQTAQPADGRNRGEEWRAWIIVAAARQQQGKHAEAIDAYKKFLDSCPSPELRQYAAEQMRICRAATLKPPGPPSRRLSNDDLATLAVVEDKQHVETTPHFVVRARNERLAKLLAEEAEGALTRVCSDVLRGQDLPEKVLVYVWPNRQEFAAGVPEAPEGAGSSSRLSTADGKAQREINLMQRDEAGKFNADMLDRALSHELCSLLVREFFAKAACPLFLEEGLSMLAEAQADDRRIRLAATAMAGQAAIPLPVLLGADREDLADPNLFYAEAFSLTDFLHSRLTDRQFREFLRHLRGGSCVAEALQRALDLAPREDFLSDLAKAWALYAIAQGQFLHALDG